MFQGGKPWQSASPDVLRNVPSDTCVSGTGRRRLGRVETFMEAIKHRLRDLYEGDSDRAHRFRYGLLVFDIATILFIVVSSFMPRAPVVEGLDVLVGLAVLTDFVARFSIERHRWRELLRPTTWADIAALVSFLAPIVGEGAGFLRILRTLRLLRTYQLLDRLRSDSGFFRRNEEVILAAANLSVFVFVMTGLVYATSAPHQSGYRQLRRCLVLHRHLTHHHRLWRRDLAWHVWSLTVRRGDDMRSDAVSAPRSSSVSSQQGKASLSGLRFTKARAGCGSLQGLRDRAEHSR